MSDLSYVLEEIFSSYTPEEMAAFKSFGDFWSQEEVRQAYEEDWEAKKKEWKPILREAYVVIQLGINLGFIKVQEH